VAERDRNFWGLKFFSKKLGGGGGSKKYKYKNKNELFLSFNSFIVVNKNNVNKNYKKYQIKLVRI